MVASGTQFNYYFICHRKLWLFANGINMEHVSDSVFDGKLIHDSSYPQRSGRYEEVAVEGIKVDFFDVKRRVILLYMILVRNELERCSNYVGNICIGYKTLFLKEKYQR